MKNEIECKVNDLKTVAPELEKEWNYEKNEQLRPEGITAYSNIKFYWKCEIGHEWLATIRNRAKGNACPYCSNLKKSKEEKDIKLLGPESVKTLSVK